jgi:hypothetical protein
MSRRSNQTCGRGGVFISIRSSGGVAALTLGAAAFAGPASARLKGIGAVGSSKVGGASTAGVGPRVSIACGAGTYGHDYPTTSATMIRVE